MGLSFQAGAFQSELGMESDEAAHFVTSLMVRDYVAQGLPGPVIPYAENYYIHYPKVAIGHWPPVFYLLAAGWMLVFPASNHSLIVFMALLGATLATTLFRVTADRFGTAAGMAAGILFLATPLTQAYTSGLMLDLPVALFSFWAMLAWVCYLKSGYTRDALLFAALASCSILTKGTGLALAFVPILSVVLVRQVSFLWKPRTLLSAAAIAVLCGSWDLATIRLVVPTMQYSLGWDYLFKASWFYLKGLLTAPGLVTSLFALVGIWTKLVRPPAQTAVDGFWASTAALALGGVLLPALVPAGLEKRFLLTALPPLLLLAVAGVDWTAEELSRFSLTRPAWRLLLGTTVVAAFGLGTFAIPPKYAYGFGEVAQDIVSRPELGHTLILCSSDANGEGMLIAEVAERERRPGHIVLRASKLLSHSDWNGHAYRLIYKSPEQILRYLQSIRVGLLVLDLFPGPAEYPHHTLLQQMVREHPEVWQKTDAYPRDPKGAAPGARVEVYRAVNFDAVPAKAIELDMSSTLQKTLTIGPD